MARSLLSEHLRPGDRIVIGQAAGEPLGLVSELFDLAPGFGRLQVFCGLSLNPAWGGDVPDALAVTTYCGVGSMGRLVAKGRARVVPASLSHLSSLIASRKLPVDAVLLQVSLPDAQGYHSLGCTLDYVWEAAQVARVVLVEVNAAVPATPGTRRFHRSDVIVARQGATPLPEQAAEAPTEAQRKVARRVAGLIPDGAALQLGIGGLASAVAQALRGHRGLRIRSGMVGDWLADLFDSGALDTAMPDACQASLALGSRRLYEFLTRESVLGFALPSQLVVPLPGAPLMAINSAIEVDLAGQVNAEFAGARYLGTVGGQTDYFRAARSSAGGLAILALPSTSGSGHSRIVRRCGHVTTAQSEVDIIVTEHGTADIRATTLEERAALIAAIADPRHRARLQSRSDHNAEPAGPRETRT